MRELVALSTLPGVWLRSEPLEIVESLAEVVLRMLGLELAYIRVPWMPGTRLEAARTREQPALPGRGADIGRMLEHRIVFDGSEPRGTIPWPDGKRLQVAVRSIGHDRDCGWLVACAQRPHFPDEHERLLLGIAANQLAVMLQRKAAEEQLREEARTLETLNLIGEAVAAELDLERVVQQVTDAATALSGAEFGAFFYNVSGEDGEAYQLYALSGATPEQFKDFPLPRKTAVFAPTFAGTGVVRSADIRRDPRYGRSPPHHGLPRGHLPVVSYLAVPVVSRSKEVLGGLFFGHSQLGVFTERAERLVLGIATQAAIAIDNARLYERVRDSAERLAEADRRKDEFLATLAHELRNPLAPLRNAVTLLEMAGDRPDLGKQARETMERQLEQLMRLVDDLLEVSRITRGRIELRKERSELRAIVNTAVETARPTVDAAHHVLVVDVPPEPVVLDADPVRLAQVFCNLLHNAAKFTAPSGRIELSASRAGEEVRIEVRDSGIGIPEEKLPHVFDLFTQVDASLERAHGGLGIGLTIVKHLVDLHGGNVQAHSEGMGRGSVFTVRLPAARPSAGASAPAPARAPSPTRARRILVVDDNADVATTLALILEELGHEVTTAADGDAALQAAEALRPELILLDIGMPKLNGFDACRRLRERPWAKSTTFIALSGWSQEAHRRRALETGFDHYLVKPVAPEALNRLLRSL